jgi:hypothetical protein
VAKKKIARRRRPFNPETDSLNVRVTAKDIAAAKRAGLSGAQLIHRAVARKIGSGWRVMVTKGHIAISQTQAR